MPAQPESVLHKQEARVLLGLPGDGYCLLFVGNDYRKKGLQAVLSALAQLSSDVVLAVVGNPAHIPAFRVQAAALKLDTRVFFLGSLPDVAPAYEAADCLVHATLEDTFAMVVLEAMSHGLPVVVSGPAYCGISGLLKDGINAMILKDPRNVEALVQTLQQLISSTALQRTLKTGAVNFASHYEWENLAAQQDDLYISALALLGQNKHTAGTDV